MDTDTRNARNAFACGFNAYRTLAVKNTATVDVIKKSYYTLAAKHHPDKSENKVRAEELFKDVVRAYEILSDPVVRSEYDDFIDEFPDRFAPTVVASRSRLAAYGGAAPWIGTALHTRVTAAFAAAAWSPSSLARMRQRRAPDSAKKMLWITLEDVYHGCTVDVCSGGKINAVVLPRGTKSGATYAVGTEVYTVRIEPHGVFQRGGRVNNTKTSDIVTHVVYPHAEEVVAQRGYISDLAGNKLMWRGAAAHDRVVLRGAGLPEVARGKTAFGDLVVVLVRAPAPALIAVPFTSTT